MASEENKTATKRKHGNLLQAMSEDDFLNGARSLSKKMVACLGLSDLSRMRDLILFKKSQLLLDHLSRDVEQRESELSAKHALIENEVEYKGFSLSIDAERYHITHVVRPMDPRRRGISVLETTLRVNLECPTSAYIESGGRPRADVVTATSFVDSDSDAKAEPVMSIHDLFGAGHRTPSWVRTAGIDLESSDLSELDLSRLRDWPAGPKDWHILGSSREGYHHSTAELPVRLYYRKAACPPAGTDASVLFRSYSGEVRCVKLKFGEHDVRDGQSDLPVCTRGRWPLQDAIVLKPLAPPVRILIVQHGNIENEPDLLPGIAVAALTRPTLFETRLLQAVATYPLMCRGPCNDAVANAFWDRGTRVVHQEVGAGIIPAEPGNDSMFSGGAAILVRQRFAILVRQNSTKLLAELQRDCDFAIHCYYADDENCSDPDLETVLDYYRKNATASTDCRKLDLIEEDMEHCPCKEKTKGQVTPDSVDWDLFRKFWAFADVSNLV